MSLPMTLAGARSDVSSTTRSGIGGSRADAYCVGWVTTRCLARWSETGWPFRPHRPATALTRRTLAVSVCDSLETDFDLQAVIGWVATETEGS